MDDNSDNSVNGSCNDGSTSAIEGSYNSFLDESIDDHSIDVGTRDYSTGFGSLGLGGGGGGGGDVWVNNQNTIVDQSFNGERRRVERATARRRQHRGRRLRRRSSIAAGNDVNLSQSVDHSTTIIGAAAT